MRAGGQKGGPRMIIQEQVDRAYRVAYRLVFPVVWCWWRLFQRHQGVVVAVWLNDTILAVRHSYKPGLRLLGGRVGRREDHRLAAARELQEEVGVLIDCDALRLVVVAPTALALDYPYEARLTAKPELMVDLFRDNQTLASATISDTPIGCMPSSARSAVNP